MLTFDITGCLDRKIGANGLTSATLDAYADKLSAAITKAIDHQKNNTLPLLRLPETTDDLDMLAPYIKKFKSFKTVVVLGTGGSSLGGKTIYSLIDQGLGINPKGPRLFFFDNIDPATFDAFFAATDLKTCGLVVISKSGTTAETLSQFLLFLDAFKKHGIKPVDHVLAITEPGARVLRDLCDEQHITTFDHDPNVGGRFSVLSIVGLLPIMIAGLDAKAVRAGASQVLDQSFAAADNPLGCPAAAGAALSIAMTKKNITQSVLMPYVDTLLNFTFWYRQLWAESLGKKGNGTTPVNALGTVDQHSQLQLYLDGPRDKLFTLVFKEAKGTGPVLQSSHAKLSYMNGRTMGDLLDAEQRATLETLLKTNRPTRLITVKTVDEKTLGALFMHFMLETIYAADLLGIDAFDQPAVEDGKILTREFLSAVKPKAA